MTQQTNHPKDWQEVRIDEIFKITVGGDLDKDSFSKTKDSIHKYPIYSNGTDNNGLYGYSSKYNYDSGCITITGRGTLGIANCRDTKFNAIIRVLVLKPLIELNCFFFSEFINNKITFNIGSTGVPQLTAPQVSIYKVPLPPLPEQKTIASILSTVDSTIQKTDELIKQTEKLKKGLMNDLLTKGIGHKKFKETELGKIPSDWQEVKLGDFISIKKGRKPHQLKEYVFDNSEVYLSTNYLRNNHIDYYAECDDNCVLVNDHEILLLWDGSNAGDIFLGKKGILSSTMVKINSSDLNQYFLYYIFKSVENFLKENTNGSGIPHVDGTLLKNIKVPLPPRPEQKAIASILSDIDKQIETLKEKKDYYIKIKKGLMDDLLSGNVRVKVE